MIESAGILLYRTKKDRTDVFLIHMGGPLWRGKDAGAWSIPKGVISPQEEPLIAAKREFEEETGHKLQGEFHLLGKFRQNSGKNLSVWCIKGEIDPGLLVSNRFSMVWPPRSGKIQSFPEADRGEWFDRRTALRKIVKGQRQVLDCFYDLLKRCVH